MVKSFLITRPNHDVNTSYLHSFAKDILKIVKTTRDIHVTDLDGDKATRDRVEEHLTRENPRLVFFNGHGDRIKICGHKNEAILDKENIWLTKDKMIYALACDCLEELGEVAIMNGTTAFIGYRARFMIVIDPSRNSSPDKNNFFHHILA